MVLFTGHDDGQVTEWQGRNMRRRWVAHKGCLTTLSTTSDGEALISGAAHFADTMVARWSTSPGDDPANTPVNRWRAYAHILFGNWINLIYQTTPFDMNHIGND